MKISDTATPPPMYYPCSSPYPVAKSLFPDTTRCGVNNSFENSSDQVNPIALPSTKLRPLRRIIFLFLAIAIAAEPCKFVQEFVHERNYSLFIQGIGLVFPPLFMLFAYIQLCRVCNHTQKFYQKKSGVGCFVRIIWFIELLYLFAVCIYQLTAYIKPPPNDMGKLRRQVTMLAAGFQAIFLILALSRMAFKS